VAGVAIIDALNLAPDTPTPVAQQAAAILPDATPTETTQPAIETPIPLTDPIAPTKTPSPTKTAQPEPISLPECIRPDAEQVLARVVDVIDGDTIEVVIANQAYKVRYIGVDTPESTREIEPFGKEAAAKNRRLVAGETVTLVKDVSETDRFGRLLRYVFVGERFVNYELVRQGYANVVRFPPDVACIAYFRTAEQQARSREIGLWGIAPGGQRTPTATPREREISAACNCTGPDLNCADFTTQARAQDCFDYCKSRGHGDIFNLDSDTDGVVCERLP
jgi:micrococcal nuclease